MSSAATTHVRVRRCSVRVRRHGGWGWGDPDDYVPRILAAIEAALADVAAAVVLEEGDERHVADPVTLHVTRDGQVTVESRRALTSRILAAAPARAVTSTASVAEHGAGAHVERAASARSVAAATGAGSLAVTLGRWSRSGRLLPILRSLPADVVHAWAHALVHASLDKSTSAPALSAEAIGAIATAVLRPARVEAAEADEAVQVLLVAGAVIAAVGDHVLDAPTMQLVVRHVTGDQRGAIERATTASPATAHHPTSPTQLSTRAELAVAGTPTGPTIVPALPFLTLIQLSRLGFTDLAAAALAAARVFAPAHVFAAAVAGKTLDPPLRGWQRTEPELAAVRLASRLDQEEVDTGLDDLAVAADLVGPAWRAALVDLYVEGRASDADACVTAVGDERICGEERGLLPIAWVDGDAELREVLAQLGDPSVRHGDTFAPLVELLEPRRGLPGLDAPSLERQLGAIVGTAIGSLGQELWGEDADVPLAFERLRDLEARVEVGDRVTIGVPRGQRWLDLRRAELLDAWPIDWAPGGVWEVVTW